MASGGHVSKRKPSSSSSKKKLSKKSREDKKRKRSRSRKKDKSRKVLRRRDVSDSSSGSDSDSRSEDSLSYSSSDSEDDYVRRKGRSRSRGDGKKGKKRVRRSSSVRDDRSESPVWKKRKGSKKNEGAKLKKRSGRDKVRKRRSKRDASVDSSGDSRELSVSSGSDDSRSLRIRTKMKEDVKKNLDKISDEGRHKYRSRSCSSGSEDSEQCPYDHNERLVSGNYTGRLRSVLTFPDKVEEEGRYKDENKAEVIHAYDDSPPSKSNDSNEVGRTIEPSHQAYALPEKERVVDVVMVDNGKRKESSQEMNVLSEKKIQIRKGDEESALRSKTKTVELVEDERRREFSHQMKIVPEKKAQMHAGNGEGDYTKGDGVVPYGGMQRTANMEATKIGNKSEIPSVNVSSELSDLETKLRQKALENLRKFRSGNQPNATVSDQKNRNGVNQPSTLKDETIKTQSSKEVDSSTARATDTKSSVMKHNSTTVTERIPVAKSLTHGAQVPDCNAKQLESRDSKRATHPSFRRPPDGNSKQLDARDTVSAVNHSQRNDKSVSDRLVDTRAPEKRIINLGGIRKSSQGSLVYRRQPSEDHSDEKTKETKSTLNRVVSGPTKVAGESSNPGKSAASEATLRSAPATREQVTTESGNAAKRGSEVKHSESENIVNKNVSSPPKETVGSNGSERINRPPVSAVSEVTSLPTPLPAPLPTPVIENYLKTESGNADDGDSEFKQKTMTVMRGGEAVQVRYKVYIPQKPRALGRRQLKR